MSKKLFAVMAVVLALFTALSLAGCDSGSGRQSGSGQNISGQTLTYDKKYLYNDSVKKPPAEQVHFTFNNNGSGKYRNYDRFIDNTWQYEITFKYLIVDDTVICFYNSITFESAHTASTDDYSSWYIVLGFSKNILLNTHGQVYICEDYLSQIPNFREGK